MTAEEITKYLVAIAAIVGAIAALSEQLVKLSNILVKPLWNKIKIPLFKILVRPAALIVPNGVIIGGALFWVATEYQAAGNLDYMITNKRVFLQLVALQAVAVSLYSFLWSTFIAPRMRNLINRWRSKTQQKTESNEQNRNNPGDDTNKNIAPPSDVHLAK
ncbi:MAG TPA: hypothetical protein VF544_12225 [Pyrinomonadaceae bacterium]|jgi:hypothetical protein